MTLPLFVWVIFLNACCYGFNFDFPLPEQTAGLEGFSTHFSKTLSELAQINSLTKNDVSEFTFEKLIEKMTNFGWFPYLDDYFSNTLEISRGNITEIRRTKVKLIMTNMPKYSLNSFWQKTFKTFIYNVGHSLLDSALENTLSTLKDIFGYFQITVQKEFEKLNVKGNYLLQIYYSMLPLIENLQMNKTVLMAKNFMISDDKIKVLTGKGLPAINSDISKFIFHALHNDEVLKTKYEDSIKSLMRKMQLYKSSIRQWSYTCSNSPNRRFGLQTISAITGGCFNMTMEETAEKLYSLPSNISLLQQYNMDEIAYLANYSFQMPERKLLDADVMMTRALNGVFSVQLLSKKPYIIVARDAGLTLQLMNDVSVGYTVSFYLKMPWELYAKTYGISSWYSTQLNRILFHEISQVKIKPIELRILPLQIIFEIVKNPEIPKSLISKEFLESLLYISKLPLETVQNIFEISDGSMKSYSLYDLANVIFGIDVNKFLEIYQIPNSKFSFFKKATIYDYSLLLLVGERDIKLFSIIQLIQQTIVDAIYADVMLSSPNKLILTEYADPTERYILSIPQIAHEYHPGIDSYQSFYKYLQKWTKSEKASLLLLENNINDLSLIILKSIPDTGAMKIIEIVSSLLASFGTPCDGTTVHCQKLQECKKTEHGSRCKCISGYRFSAPNICSDLDECLFAKVTCDDQATCQNTLGSYKCFCNSGFVGSGQTCTNINECNTRQGICHVNATCTDTVGSYNCVCNDGFRGDGHQCSDINECAEGSHNCHVNALCTNTMGSFQCSCKSTYIGDGVNMCSDVDECKDERLHQCPKNSNCVNKVGSHNCVCIGGFYKDKGMCHQCLEGGGNCHINAECFTDPFENYCVCKSGFKGNGTYCEDFNECKENNPCLHGECKNHVGSYSCLCDDGFRANAANQNCKDIDECKEATVKKISLCNDTYMACVNVPGAYSCVSNKPNTSLRIALGVTFPLVIIIIVLLLALRILHRRYKGKKELNTFDKRLDAMYVNKGFEMEDENRNSSPTDIKDNDSKTKRTTNFMNKPLKYILKKGKKEVKDEYEIKEKNEETEKEEEADKN